MVLEKQDPGLRLIVNHVFHVADSSKSVANGTGKALSLSYFSHCRWCQRTLNIGLILDFILGVGDGTRESSTLAGSCILFLMFSIVSRSPRPPPDPGSLFRHYRWFSGSSLGLGLILYHVFRVVNSTESVANSTRETLTLSINTRNAPGPSPALPLLQLFPFSSPPPPPTLARHQPLPATNPCPPPTLARHQPFSATNHSPPMRDIYQWKGNLQVRKTQKIEDIY